MTISSTNRKAGPYTGNGITTAFTFSFKVFQAADVYVVRQDPTSLVETVLVLNSDYTVTLNTNQNSNPGGTVTLLAALATDFKLTITSNLGNLQPTDLTNQGGFYPTVINDALDRATIQIQQLAEDASRALTIPLSSTASAELPAPVAGTVLAWNASGTAIENLDAADLATSVAYSDWKYDVFTANGTQTQFVLQANPGNVANLDVSINGVTQVPGTDYTLSGNVLTFTSAPPNTAKVLARYGQATTQVNVSYSSQTITATAGQTVFTITSGYAPGSNAIAVYQNGSRLTPGADYVETNSTTVTLVIGATAGDVLLFVTAETINPSINDAASISYSPAGTGAVATNVQTKLRETVSVKDFGAVGDGVTNDTSAILNALASLTSGGALYFPAGTYKFQRGTGILISDTITVSNVLIYGDGAASKISGYNAAGAIPNDVGNQFYNVFQATSRSNITIKDMAFEGYTTPASMFSCTNIVIDNIFDNGQLANAGGYMRDKSIYLEKCADVRIVNSRFINFQFAVYVGGDGTTSSSRVIVNACSFEHTTAAGSYTTLFPVGVYWYYSAECVVNGCTFLNIYSSVDSGTTGTGMGYGVYEGDGATTSGVISNNVFRFNAKGNKNAMGIYLNEMQECSVSGNTFFVATNGRMVTGIYLDSKNQDSKYSVTGNTFDIKSTAVSMYPIYVTGTSTNSPKIAISGNTINGGFNGIRQDGLGNAKLNITGNNINASTSAGIQLSGTASLPLKNVVINGNTITGSGTNAIYFNQYVVSPSIMNNTLLDGNTTSQAGDSGAAVLFVSNSYGSFIANNVIGNTAYGGGLFTLGVQNAANAANRIFKDITFGNTFVGLSPNNQFGRWWTTSPTNQIFDVTKGDFFQNVQLGAGGNPGWFCVETRTPSLTADASSASTTITVNSTSSILAGDIVLLCKDANPYDSDYYTAAQWHVDTVASITSGTQFVLTTGIPAGDGTYVAGTAFVKTARFKAAAAIAA